MTRQLGRRLSQGAPGGAWAPFVSGLLFAFLGCSQSAPNPGAVRFLVRATPAPDDTVLSPLRDLRVTALELRDARTDDSLARSRFDPPASSVTGSPMLPALDLASGPVARVLLPRRVPLGFHACWVPGT